MAATSQLMGDLHQEFAALLLEKLRDRDKETNKPTITAAEMAVLRALLKDNEVTMTPETTNVIGELRDELEQRRRAKKNMRPQGTATAESDAADIALGFGHGG